MPKNQGEWKEVGKQQVKLEEGEEFVGVLTGKEESTLGVGVWSFQPEDGGDEVVMLGSVGLDRMMEKVEIGKKVRILLQDITQTKQNRPFKNYRVFVAQ